MAEKIAAWPAGEHPIHLTVTDKSTFSQRFLKLLRVQLLNRGVTLATGPTEVELQIEAQLVQHLEPLSASPPVPLHWTALGAGVGVWRDWREHYSDRSLLPGMATLLGVGTGLAVDPAQHYTQGDAAGGPTRTEVLITTALKTTDRYLAGSAVLYYIERGDAPLYLPEPPPPPPPPPTPVKSWRVTAPTPVWAPPATP